MKKDGSIWRLEENENEFNNYAGFEGVVVLIKKVSILKERIEFEIIDNTKGQKQITSFVMKGREYQEFLKGNKKVLYSLINKKVASVTKDWLPEIAIEKDISRIIEGC